MTRKRMEDHFYSRKLKLADHFQHRICWSTVAIIIIIIDISVDGNEDCWVGDERGAREGDEKKSQILNPLVRHNRNRQILIFFHFFISVSAARWWWWWWMSGRRRRRKREGREIDDWRLVIISFHAFNSFVIIKWLIFTIPDFHQIAKNRISAHHRALCFLPSIHSLTRTVIHLTINRVVIPVIISFVNEFMFLFWRGNINRMTGSFTSFNS